MKPFIKWVGGKSKTIDNIFKRFPSEINNYYELFLGGGSVLIELLNRLERSEIKINGKIYVNDINTKLMMTYQQIKTNSESFIKDINELSIFYNNNSNKENLYYKMRDIINSNLLDEYNTAIYMIILNKTCFRGLYRENSDGKNNVPFGNYSNSLVIDIDNLKKLSLIFNKYNVEFLNKSFSDFKLEQFQINDFIYMDPPYIGTFSNYTKYIFTQNEFIEYCQKLYQFNISFAMSNSDNEELKQKFINLSIDNIESKCRINSKRPSEKMNEILISFKNTIEKNKILVSEINKKITKEEVENFLLSDTIFSISNKSIIDWITFGNYFKYCYTNKLKSIEFNWGRKITMTIEENNQWTTLFCEKFVKLIFETNGVICKEKPKYNNLLPDLETDKYLIEIKGRTYTTTGTAGEKILYVPYKYGDLALKLSKKLLIVVVGYQEVEAIEKFKLFSSEENFQKEIIEFYKKNNIFYVKCSDLLLNFNDTINQL